jgi:NADH:ubiquinone oxidoreductase subunit H
MGHLAPLGSSASATSGLGAKFAAFFASSSCASGPRASGLGAAWLVVRLWKVCVVCLLVLCGVMEGSRIPADLPECESELVSG